MKPQIETLINQIESYNVSNRYSHINTGDLIAWFEQRGFAVSASSAAQVRKQSKEGYQRHLIRMRSATLQASELQSRGLTPEVVIVNSHDGASSLKILFGVYRIACANGLIIGDTFKSIKIRHVGDINSKLNEVLPVFAAGLSEITHTIEALSKTELSFDQQARFANLALKYALPDGAVVLTSEVLRPRRVEDVSNDAFTVFNRIQEKVLGGGIRYMSFVPGTDKTRYNTTRRVKSIPRIVELNQKLWDLALEVSHV